MFLFQVLLKNDADPLMKNKRGETPRQYYQQNVDMYDIDPFIVKTLRELEERLNTEKLQNDLILIENNKQALEVEKKRNRGKKVS